MRKLRRYLTHTVCRSSAFFATITNHHSWASASRPTPPASAFCISLRYRSIPVSRNGSYYPGTGLVPASAFSFIPVPEWPDAGQSGILALIKNTPCTSTMQAMDKYIPCSFTLLAVESGTPCMSILQMVENDTPCTRLQWFSQLDGIHQQKDAK